LVSLIGDERPRNVPAAEQARCIQAPWLVAIAEACCRTRTILVLDMVLFFPFGPQFD